MGPHLSPNTCLDRVDTLLGNISGLNDPFLFDPSSVHIDSQVDQLFGSAGLDWFWLSNSLLVLDKINNRVSGEVIRFE